MPTYFSKSNLLWNIQVYTRQMRKDDKKKVFVQRFNSKFTLRYSNCIWAVHSQGWSTNFFKSIHFWEKNKTNLNSLIVIPLFRYLKDTSLKGGVKIFLIIKNGLSNWCTSCLIFNHKILLCTVGQQYKIILIHFYSLH